MPSRIFNDGIFGLNVVVEPVRVAIIGKQCSGKTTLANAISEKLDRYGPVEIVKFADPIYEALHIFTKTKHREFMQDFGDFAKKYFGEHVFAELFEKKVLDIIDADLKHSAILCDDVRRNYEFDVVKAHNFITVFIDAPEDIRMARAKKLGIKFVPHHNSEIYVDDMKSLCDLHFNGDCEIKKMQDYVEAILIYANTR